MLHEIKISEDQYIYGFVRETSEGLIVDEFEFVIWIDGIFDRDATSVLTKEEIRNYKDRLIEIHESKNRRGA